MSYYISDQDKALMLSCAYFTLNTCDLLLYFRICSDGHIVGQRTPVLFFFIFWIAY